MHTHDARALSSGTQQSIRALTTHRAMTGPTLARERLGYSDDLRLDLPLELLDLSLAAGFAGLVASDFEGLVD